MIQGRHSHKKLFQFTSGLHDCGHSAPLRDLYPGMRYIAGQEDAIPSFQFVFLPSNLKMILPIQNIENLVLIGVDMQGYPTLGRQTGLLKNSQVAVGVLAGHFHVQNILVYAFELNVAVVTAFAGFGGEAFSVFLLFLSPRQRG